MKILQHACCEWVGCRILPFCMVQMLEFTCIFGCALLAAYTVAPRHSSLGCLPASYLEIYGCLAAPADAASLCRCKLVCSASVSAYIRHRNACRIYCSASVEQHSVACRSLSGDMCVPYGPLICRILCNCKPACIAPASANKFAPRRLLCIFGIALLAAYTVAPRHSSLGCLPQSVWRYMCALRPTHLQNPLQLQACLHCTGFCKQVCTAQAPLYIRHRFACRIYCSASA